MAHVVWNDAETTLVMGVGESYRLDAWQRILPKLKTGIEHRERLEVGLVAEPTNKFDPKAVKMVVKGEHLGYVPRLVAESLFDQVVDVTENGDTLGVPGSIWAVKRADGLKANVSMFVPDDVLDNVDTEYLESPADRHVTTQAKRDPERTLQLWGLGLGLFTLIGSSSGFSVLMVAIAAGVVNWVAYKRATGPKQLPLVGGGATALGLVIGIIVGITKAVS